MEDSADITRSAGSEPSGSRSGFKLSAKLGARLDTLLDWRIDASSIRFPDDPCEFHGGHANVSKAFLPDEGEDDYDGEEDGDEEDDHDHNEEEEEGNSWSESDNLDRDLQEDRRSSGSDYQIREAADRRRDDEGEDKEKDGERGHGPGPGGENLRHEKVGHGRFLRSFRTTVERL
ncbi:hypothetical protein FRC05_001113 [Tulasnella sp. 425]|nr:hypothetical protein FRC05_001113 [Tulasnella sp. 425]